MATTHAGNGQLAGLSGKERPSRHPSGKEGLLTEASQHSVAADLIAVLAAVTAQDPRTLTIQNGSVLPSGAFQSSHRSLQAGLRAWVERQTRQPVGYVEQLYTFADRNRADASGHRVISISYLGLMR
ncbi:MAG: hypothetical protein JOZ58_25725, partial [Acetobacteraceae bacterium]|nr:hypothetical protein [Acetobacteraceae bacterium]